MHWASLLQWISGSGYFIYAKVALDFESHSNRARQVLPLLEGAGSLREAVNLLQPLLTLLERAIFGEFVAPCCL